MRVIRTCRELGIATVAVYSELDRDALHVRLADEAYALGRADRGRELPQHPRHPRRHPPQRRRRPCTPGTGSSARTPTSPGPSPPQGVIFVGPPPEAIEVMGDKVSSRKAAAAAGVAGVPGTLEFLTGPDEVVAFGDEHGWPVAIKAAYGGGGRGMKVVPSADKAAELLESGAARGQVGVRPRRVLPRAVPDLAAPHRDADLRRPAPATASGSASATAPPSAATRS